MAPIRIALLICGGLTGRALEENGDYLEVYTRFFEATAPQTGTDNEPPFTLDPYFVVKKQEYPDPDKYDALVLTGSAASAYEPLPWITSLIAYIVHVVETAPQLKIIGICFGHQIVAHALGGNCVANDRWEVGPARVRLTDLGVRVFGSAGSAEPEAKKEMEDNEIVVQQMHRDHVPELPPKFHLLGANTVSPVHAMVRFASAVSQLKPAGPFPPVHVLAVQGHPEFPEQLIAAIVEARGASGAMDAHTVEEYGKHGRGVNDDGLGRVARAIWAVMRGDM